MVLSEDLLFKAVLQKGNRVQIPVLIREAYGLQSGDTFKFRLGSNDSFTREVFFAKLQLDGRLTVPRVIVKVLNLEPGQILSVKIFATQANS